MPHRPCLQGRIAAKLSVLVLVLALAGCTAADTASRDDPSGVSDAGRGGAASGAGGEVCVPGRPTGEGVECQAFRAEDGGLYTLIGNLGDLAGEKVCVCGRRVELSTCMQGTTIAVRRIGPLETCP